MSILPSHFNLTQSFSSSLLPAVSLVFISSSLYPKCSRHHTLQLPQLSFSVGLSPQTVKDLVNVFEVFLPQLLLYPNPSDPLNREAAALMMRDRIAYEQRIKEYCEKYAKQEDIGSKPEEISSNDEPSEDDYVSEDEQFAGKADL